MAIKLGSTGLLLAREQEFPSGLILEVGIVLERLVPVFMPSP